MSFISFPITIILHRLKNIRINYLSYYSTSHVWKISACHLESEEYTSSDTSKEAIRPARHGIWFMYPEWYHEEPTRYSNSNRTRSTLWKYNIWFFSEKYGACLKDATYENKWIEDNLRRKYCRELQCTHGKKLHIFFFCFSLLKRILTTEPDIVEFDILVLMYKCCNGSDVSTSSSSDEGYFFKSYKAYLKSKGSKNSVLKYFALDSGL